jgi:hypothetical protein
VPGCVSDPTSGVDDAAASNCFEDTPVTSAGATAVSQFELVTPTRGADHLKTPATQLSVALAVRCSAGTVDAGVE